jgi:hypothetical protein
MEQDYLVMATVTELSWVLQSARTVQQMRWEKDLGNFHHKCIRNLQSSNSHTQASYHLKEQA